MRQRRFHTACLAILAVLALSGGIASAPSVAFAQTTSAPDASTITTQLQPGWNMVGWVGPETLSGQLFEELPSLRRISAWDAEEQRYRRAWPNINRDSLRLMPGTGLLLFIDGDAPLQWTHPVGPDGALQRLRPGLNLVGWTGDDGTPVGEALDRLGDSVITAWDWDAGSGQYASYDLGASGAASTSLRRGDALWIRVSEPVNWWQPGTAEPPIFFLGEIPAHIRMAVLEEYHRVRAFFAERFGVVATDTLTYVGADEESLGSTYFAAFGREIGEDFCGGHPAHGTYVVALRCAYPIRLLGLEYQHMSALLTPGGLTREPDGPEWMFRGTQRYVQALYDATQHGGFEGARRNQIEGARRARLPLSSVDMRDNEDTWRSWAIGGVGFLAMERLAARAGDPAIFEYFRLLQSSGTWEKAFAAAFGITVEDFYAEFEEYRAEVAPPVPHIADDQKGATVVFVGEVPAETQAAILADLDQVSAFMLDLFEAEPRDFTLYIGPDFESVQAAVPRLSRSTICTPPRPDWAAIALDSCGLFDLHEAFQIDALLPSYSTSPEWLRYGLNEYATTAYRTLVKGLDLDERLEWLSDLARRSPRSLESREDYSGTLEAGFGTTRAVGFFAVDWLVKHAGFAAPFDFYEQLRNSWNWREVFEATFGIGLDDFYEAFANYRAEITQQ